MVRPRPHLSRHLQRPTGSGSLPTHDAESRPFIRLQTLGAATILVGDMRVGAAAGTMFSLLVRACYATGMMVGRDELLEMLWPELSDLRRRGNLRQLLYKLRGYGVRIAMVGDAVQLDVHQVLDTFSLERTSEYFDRDVTHGHEPFGTFLPGFVVPWPELQRWIDEQRELIHADVRHVLMDQLRRRRERADWGGAEALARSLLQFDALNEEATLTIAECTALSGSKSEAVAILDRYLEELGAAAGDIRLPASLLRKRILDPTPRARRSFAPTERHFVGRETELADLTLAMRRARWHDGSAVLVHGPAGMGKSRLAHELTKVAAIEGFAVHQVACRERDIERTLSVFLDLTPDLLGQSGALGCSPTSLAVLRRLVPVDRSTMSVSDPLHVPLSRDPMPTALAMRRAVVDLFEALSHEKPMLLIVDDVHWIDDHSWDVLSDLIERLQSMRVFVMLTSREPHARAHPPQRVPIAMRVVRLPALAPTHCVQLSRAISDDLLATVSDELSEWFVGASEGIPLFLRSLVNHWIETGEAGGVPPTLQGVIDQRLSRLSGDAIRVLQTATLLGKWATVERVVRVLELRTNEMLGCLDQIEALGAFVSPKRKTLVAHELVGKAAKMRIAESSACELHHRIGDLLMREGSEIGDGEMLICGLEHLRSAGDSTEFARQTLCFLDDVLSLGVDARALSAIRQVDRSTLSEADRSRLSRASARLLALTGDCTRALAETSNSWSIPTPNAELSDDDADAALTVVDSAYRADPEVDRQALLDFTLAVARLPHLSKRTRLRACDIGLIFSANQCDEVLANKLFRAAEISDLDLAESEYCRRVALVYHTQFGDRGEAKRLAGLLLTYAESNRDLETAYHDSMRAGFALRVVGDDDTHLRALKLSFEIATETSMPINALNAAFHLTHCYLEEGDQTLTRVWLDTMTRLFEKIDDPLVCNYVRSTMCRHALEEGRQQDARRLLEDFRRHLPTRPSLRAEAYTLALDVATEMLDDRWTPSSQVALQLRSYVERLGPFGTTDFLAAICIEVILRLHGPDEADKLFNRFVRKVRRETSRLGARLHKTETLIRQGWRSKPHAD